MTSNVKNIDCLVGLKKINDKSIEFAIIDAPYDYYSTNNYQELLNILNDKLSLNSLLIIFTNNKYLIDAGYYAKKYFNYWFMQHWIYDDGYLIHKTQPKDANRTILYFKNGKPDCNIDSLRGKKINKKETNKGSKFRSNDIGKKYVWKPNENGSHPLTYFYHQHTSETHSSNEKKPTGVKPLLVCEMIISFSNSKNVFDLFCGNGSFRIASFNLKKNYYGFEINDEYFQSQEKRYLNHINQLKLF